MSEFSRRHFGKMAVCALAAAGAAPLAAATRVPIPGRVSTRPGAPSADFLRLAVTTWSFHMPLMRGQLKAVDVPGLVKSLGIDTVEWTSKVFRDLSGGPELMFQAPSAQFFRDVRKASDAAGVDNRVVNVGGPYFLAGAEKATRDKAVDWTLQYVEPAQILGAKIMRTELYCDLPEGPGRARRATDLAMEGLHALLDRTKDSGLIINVENHHGISAQPEWLAGLIRAMNHPRLGLTVDTNNNRVDDSNPYALDPKKLPHYIDRYRGLEILMPFANWISAKTYTFDSAGYEIALEYPRILSIILKSGYAGPLSIEYEGNLEPVEGVRRSITMFRMLKEHLSELP